MSKIVLIGGGSLGHQNKEYTMREIDKKIVDLTDMNNPTLVFIGFASNSSESYFNTIKKIYEPLGCKCQNLKRKNLIKNYSLALDKLRKANIIYISGGDTTKLLNEIKEFNLEKELNNALENNCLLVGISAGGILLSKEGYSDTLKLTDINNDYTFVEGLNFIDISFCPHYDIEEKKESLKDNIKNTNKQVYSLEDNTALTIIDNKIDIIKSDINKKVYLCYYNKNKYMEEEIK